MKNYKLLTILLLLLLIFYNNSDLKSQLKDRDFINPAYREYNINSVAVYVKGYELKNPDKRKQKIDKIYNREKARSEKGYYMKLKKLVPYGINKIMEPAPTCPGYPIEQSTKKELKNTENKIKQKVEEYISSKEYTVKQVKTGSAKSIKNLCDEISNEVDALVVLRFFRLTDYIELGDMYSVSYGQTIVTKARSGKKREGLAIIPCIDIYDTKSKNIIYQSFGHTLNDLRTSISDQQITKLFVDGQEPVDKAVESAISVIDDESPELPVCSENKERNEGTVHKDTKKRKLREIFNYPYYSHYFNISMDPGIGITMLPEMTIESEYSNGASKSIIDKASLTTFSLTVCRGTFSNFDITLCDTDIGWKKGVNRRVYDEVEIFYSDTDDWYSEWVDTIVHDQVTVWYGSISLMGAGYHIRVNDRLSVSAGASVAFSFYSAGKGNQILPEAQIDDSFVKNKDLITTPINLSLNYSGKIPVSVKLKYIPDFNAVQAGLYISIGAGSYPYVNNLEGYLLGGKLY